MWKNDSRSQPMLMHPAIFISASVLVGILFALQEWVFMRQWGYHFGASIVFAEWGVDFLLWGTLCWLMWCFLRLFIQRATVLQILTRFVPFSIATSIVQEMIWVFIFPNVPVNRPHMHYWKRLAFNLDADIANNLVIIWCAFFLFRGLGYYQQLREKEQAAAKLEIELVNARMAALRMQFNPHFLFNAMNSISSLMRFDIDAADAMLEQLSSLLRISLERGNVQLISLREEMEFIEVYLAMQARRYWGRVQQTISIDPELYDALVPTMLLQPIVENAYAHGLSKVDAGGELAINVQRDGKQMCVRVLNSGVGLKPASGQTSDGHGVGLANLEIRLKLHYGDRAWFSLVELDPKHVQAMVGLPVQFSQGQSELLTRFGA
jgi:hypothetical protein